MKNKEQHEGDERAQEAARAGDKREDKALVHFAARPEALAAFLHGLRGEIRLTHGASTCASAS